MTDDDVRAGARARRRSRSTASARRARRTAACASCRAATARRRTRSARRCSRPGRRGMVSVAGGKLTTYRRIALDALDHLGVRGLSKRPRPLPGATGLDRIAWPDELDTRDAQPPAPPLRLARARGARAGRGRSVAARAARPGPARPPRAGALRARRTSGRAPTRTCSAAARPPGSAALATGCQPVALESEPCHRATPG